MAHRIVSFLKSWGCLGGGAHTACEELWLTTCTEREMDARLSLFPQGLPKDQKYTIVKTFEVALSMLEKNARRY